MACMEHFCPVCQTAVFNNQSGPYFATLRETLQHGIAECGWDRQAIIDLLVNICSRYPRIERTVCRDLIVQIAKELGAEEEDDK
jgi:hypothetical protein